MSGTTELAGILTGSATGENPKKYLNLFLQTCVERGENVAAIINAPIGRYSNRTSVHLAVVNGLHDCLDVLLTNGGDPNCKSGPADMCQAPLHLAARKGHLHCLEVLLLKHEAQMDILDSGYLKPRDVLVKGRIECHKVFDHAIARNRAATGLQDKEKEVVQVLHQLVDSGDTESFKRIYYQLLVEHKDLAVRWTDLNQKTLLYRAVEEGLSDIVECMLEGSHCEPLHNIRTIETPLVAACRIRNHHIANLLLKHSPGLLFPYESHDVCLPLTVAVRNGDNILVGTVLTQLIQSCQYKKKHRLNLDFYDASGSTLLLNACLCGHPEVVQTLLEFCARNLDCITLDVNTRHKHSGRTPLHETAQTGDATILESLLAIKNIDVNVEARPSEDMCTHLVAASPNTVLPCDEHVPQRTMTTDSRFQISSPAILESSGGSGIHQVSMAANQPEAARQESPVTDIGQGQVQPSNGETSACLYLSSSGKFTKLGHTPRSGYQRFDQISVTPLAVACAYGHTHIVCELLKHGAHDNIGLACRIAHLVQRADLIQLILPHHCSITEGTCTNEYTSTAALKLDWDKKKLPSCDAPNLSSNAEYFPCNPPPAVSTKFYSKAITTVCLNDNNLPNVPITLFQLPSVVHINLSHNELSVLPVENGADFSGWECYHLQELNLSHNLLGALPSLVLRLPNLISFDGSHNRLGVFECVESQHLSKAMNILDLSYNELKALPLFLFEFPQLSVMVLHHNHLETIPDIVWKCKTLKELDVSHNHLTCLPLCESEKKPGYHQNEFNLSASITTLLNPPSFGRSKLYSSCSTEQTMTVRSLRTLHSSQPISWSILMTPLEFSSLHTLKLSYNNLEAFPETLACFAPNLRKLDISNNSINSVDIQFVPPLIDKLTANNCQIKQFGKENNPQVLECHSGSPGMPCQHRYHRNLFCLKRLSLCNNQLERFQLTCRDPEKADGDEDDTTFQPKVPMESLLYPILESLELRGNHLRGCFNPNIGHQLHLRSVVLSCNPELTALPNELAYLKPENESRTFFLSYDRCPKLFDPPREYLFVGITHLLTFMKARLKETVFYRTIKLFLVGNGKRGKTTLLNRLRGLHFNKEYDSTVGIDIAEWTYPDPRKTKQGDPRKPVTFLAWDFAGQDGYHTSHQCFYSKRSLYLALFRLTDGTEGVNELEPWLQNIKLRAPGSPVIIIGTHLDQVKAQRAQELECEVSLKYNRTSGYYPQIVSVLCVSSLEGSIFRRDTMEDVRKCIYRVARHLRLKHDGIALEYKKDLEESDPRALFQQQIPKSYLDLQESILEKARSLNEENIPPLMKVQEFCNTFNNPDKFSDCDELNEAVYFLSLQGTMLHYNDPELKDVYFLDPQWLANLMAMVIRPADRSTQVQNGVAAVDGLFPQCERHEGLKEVYISLLEKFDVVRKLQDGHNIIIPSLMPERVQYPSVIDIPSDLEYSRDEPPLRRFWFSNSIPNGFWPRLICRITSDIQIEKVLGTLFPVGPGKTALAENWITWKCGIAFVHDKRILIVMRQEASQRLKSSGQRETHILRGSHRIILHIYLGEWLKVVSGLIATKRNKLSSEHLTPAYITSQTTRFMIIVSNHLKALATAWFPGMILSPKHSTASYAPCWKCFARIGPEAEPPERSPSDHFAKSITYKDAVPLYCFNVDECVVPAALEREMKCRAHGKIDIKQLAPDLVFCDMDSSDSGEVVIETTRDSKPLGIGGYGFVCKGKLQLTNSEKSKDVAVKVFISDMDCVRGRSTEELLKISRDPKRLVHAYREIRQEVSFLSALENPYLAQMFCAKTSPYMCFLLELAPNGSLHSVLKEFNSCKMPLEPLTLRTTSLQIANGLEYLHSHQIVHLDMKSSNVLVWDFPSPRGTPETRLKEAGFVWVKIADFGISQVSTRLKFKVGFPPPGTPGYMAPELFDSSSQEISADKVDVFAYGMTLYELLSLQPPFSEIEPLLRKEQIRRGRRPRTDHMHCSVLPFQELMNRCWEGDPEERPNMEQVTRFIDSDEFYKLRVQESVKAVSYACICRVLPQKEEVGPVTGSFETDIDHSSDQECGAPKQDNPGVRRNNLLQLIDVEGTQYCKIPNLVQAGEATASISATVNIERNCDKIEPASTQAWLYSRINGQGFLQIFVWFDGTTEHYSCSCKCEEVSALCPIGNTVWMGDSAGMITIKFFDRKLKCIFRGELKMRNQDNQNVSSVLDICHIEESSTVLISTRNGESGEIWFIHDRIVSGALEIMGRLHQPVCNSLINVKMDGVVTVWGTMNSESLLLLTEDSGKNTKEELTVTTDGLQHHKWSLIAQTRFIGRDAMEHIHIWVAGDSHALLVSVDVTTKLKYCEIDCYKEFQNETTCRDFHLTTLVASGKQVIVGTSNGKVGIIDAGDKRLLKILSCHVERVQALLVMPNEMLPGVCSEIPFTKEESQILPTATMNCSKAANTTSPDPSTTLYTANNTEVQPSDLGHTSANSLEDHTHKTPPLSSTTALPDQRDAVNDSEPVTNIDDRSNPDTVHVSSSRVFHGKSYFVYNQDSVEGAMVASVGLGRSYSLHVKEGGVYRDVQEGTVLLMWRC